MKIKQLLSLGMSTLVLVSLLCSCQAPDDDLETENESEDVRDSIYSITQSAINDGGDVFDTYIINGKIAIFRDHMDDWNEYVDGTAKAVVIRPYDICDLDPCLDPTLYDGFTYEELFQRYSEKSTLVALDQALGKEIADTTLEVLKASKEQLDDILLQQQERKIKSVVDRLESIGVPSQSMGENVFASLTQEQLMILEKTSCIFFVVSYPFDRNMD